MPLHHDIYFLERTINKLPTAFRPATPSVFFFLLRDHEVTDESRTDGAGGCSRDRRSLDAQLDAQLRARWRAGPAYPRACCGTWPSAPRLKPCAAPVGVFDVLDGGSSSWSLAHARQVETSSPTLISASGVGRRRLPVSRQPAACAAHTLVNDGGG
jgi:hypothetical protein